MNEELIYRAHGMIFDRYKYYHQQYVQGVHLSAPEHVRNGFSAIAAAYKSVYDMLWYAINDNEECLKEFDYYRDKIEENK